MASSVPASSTVIESLPTRPPTPPRETLPESRLCLKAAVLARSPFNPRLQLSTPPNPNSPLSTGATNSNSPSKRLRKKVEWSAHTEYKDPPQYREGSKLHRSSPLSAPASVSRPIKGILKPSPSPNPLASSLHGNLDGLSSQANIAEMLESTIKQLAGSDRDSRLDAYMMLSRALKASNNLPDRVALQDKMSLFMQFIQRDVKSRTENGSPDYSLINHALTLLTTFLHFQAIASTLTSDFGVFIIDHCIRSFDDPAVPKDLVRHLMQVVAFQSFSAKVMTLDRVGRLVASMHKIEDRLTGKSIVMGRIQIYKRLIKQSRSHMAIHADWMMDMFTDMMSTVRDIRTQAISLAADAGFSLRNEKPIMRKATEIFQTMDGEETYIEFYIRKLEAMVKDRACSSAVPQIWSAVTLFLRCPLDRWQYFGPWLKLAQSAFNTTDTQTKQEANYAWNRYVYLSLIDAKTAPKALGLLAQPLISQLRRKVSTKQAEEGMKLRRIVIGGICNLYYYAFRPHDSTSTDTVWDLALQPVMAQLINLDGKPETHSDSMLQASRILAGLLDVSTPRSWREDRIRDMPLVTPEDLPSIDSKWTRRNSEKVFQLVGPILEKKFTDLANKESLTYRLWQALVGSIAAASAKDIKVSDDTAKFFACAFGVLSKVWSQGYSESEESVNSKFLPSVKNFIHVLVTSLGLLPFTEKRLSLSMSNTFEPSATPSHRPDKSRGATQAPVYHLFSILCSVPPGATDDETLCHFFQSVFEPFFNEKSTKIRVEHTREMLRLLPRDAQAPYGPWVLAADNMRLTLEQIFSSSVPPSSERLLGPEYREVVSLLERGLLSHPNLPSTAWFSLFNFLSDHIVQECGDAGRALGLVEPIAKILLENFFKGLAKPNQTALTVTTMLFKVAKLPRDRQAVEAARRRLWGAPPTISRASTFDPFDNLYKLQEQSMQFLYNDLANSDSQESIASYIESINAFLATSFPQIGVKTLSKLQDGLAPWIQDDKAQLKLSDGSPVSSALRLIWDSLNVHLVSLGHLENKDLNLIEPLISAGFRSKHRYVVNKMAETWNSIFKDEDSLECSDSLKAIITALRPQVDVSFPGIESSGEFGAQVQSFIGSQDELSFIALSSTKSSRPEAEQATPPAASLTTGGFKGPMTRKRRREATPDVAHTKSAKRKTKSRLRHDNSQIQFAPIAPSSPLAEESQHLTERQKEVRQRQQENAGVISGVTSSPRTRSRTSLEEKSKGTPVSSRTRRQNTTPERPASYEEFISSTPTPRRGQALQMEDYNDPPSSPPEPRPNPLLSEIQTRSRGRSSLVNWEFSSPPGTPPTSHQKTTRESQASQIDSEESNMRRRSRRKTRSSSQFDPQVIPSSVPVEEVSPVPAQAPKPIVSVEVKSESREIALEAPSTPSRRAISPDSKGQDTPRSADDEYVDARSSPEDTPREEAPVLASELADSQEHDSSFELSEVDESGMMRLVVELEARQCNLPFDNVHSASPEKKASQSATGCIMVQDDSPASASASPEKTQRTRSLSPVIPSTPAHQESEASQSQPQSQPRSRRKRRRSMMYAETRGKRKRSNAATPLIQPAESQPKPLDNNSPAPATRRSSRRNAGMKSKKYEANESLAQSVKQSKQSDSKEVAQVDRVDGRDSGDTDEELMSQLVTESNAASQSQQHEVEPEPGLPISNDPMELDEADEDKVEEIEELEAELQENSGARSSGEAKKESNKTSTIFNLLRGGLNELREAALSRDEVYQLEDMLMDMKRELFEAERRGR